MFERFTDRARRVVVLAQEEARGFNHDHIGTEHLLLGLVTEGEGIAATSLEMLGVSAAAVREAIEERIGRGKESPKGHIPFTPRAKKVLEMSLREALKLRHDYIGTEHVLLGLLAEGEGVAAQVLLSTVTEGLEALETEVIGRMVEAGTLSRGEKNYREMKLRMQRGVTHPGITVAATDDEVLKRLEAIEARLSSIERTLREQRDEEAS